MLIFGINYIFVILEQKAWSIAHHFDRFWTIFDPYLIMLIFEINYNLVIFQQKAWSTAHNFDLFWTIFDP